jgi:hypothetical protein
LKSRTPPGGFIFVLAVCVVASEDPGPSETFSTLAKVCVYLCVWCFVCDFSPTKIIIIYSGEVLI